MVPPRLPVIPDGGWGWVVVVGSFLVHVLADGFVYSFGVLLEELVVEFQASSAFVTVILSLLTGLTLGFGPVASAVTDKYGCRISTIVGSCIATVGCAITFFATGIPYICVTVGVIMGIGIGLMYCPAIVIVTMYFEKRRALATGVAVSGAGIGTWIFPQIYGYIRTAFGWRYVFLFGAGCMAICGLCGATFRPLQFIEADDDEDNTEKSESSAKDGNETTKESAALLAPPSALKATSNTSPHSAGRVGRSSGDLSDDDAEKRGHRSRAGTVTEGTGYLSVKRVLYTGSITDVAEFKENPDKYRSMTSLHSHKPSKLGELKEIGEGDDDVFEDEKADEKKKGGIWNTAVRMLNLDLLAEPAFVLFAVSNLLTSVGFNSPLYFLPMYANKGLGLGKTDGDTVLSVFGICNTVGRITFGLVGDRRLPFLPFGWGNDAARNRLWIYNLSLSICGLVTCLSFVFDNYVLLCIYSGTLGFTISSYICLTSVILVDLLGLERLNNAFGLLLLFQGVGTVFGPPLSGWPAEINGNDYNYSFFFCGVNLLVSGVMMFLTPCVRKDRPAPVSDESIEKCRLHNANQRYFDKLEARIAEKKFQDAKAFCVRCLIRAACLVVFVADMVGCFDSGPASIIDARMWYFTATPPDACNGYTISPNCIWRLRKKVLADLLVFVVGEVLNVLVTNWLAPEVNVLEELLREELPDSPISIPSLGSTILRDDSINDESSCTVNQSISEEECLSQSHSSPIDHRSSKFGEEGMDASNGMAAYRGEHDYEGMGGQTNRMHSMGMRQWGHDATAMAANQKKQPMKQQQQQQWQSSQAAQQLHLGARGYGSSQSQLAPISHSRTHCTRQPLQQNASQMDQQGLTEQTHTSSSKHGEDAAFR